MARKRISSSQLNKLEENKYNFNRLTYPSTGIATAQIPNYVIFYINVPEGAKYIKNSSTAAVVEGGESNSDKLRSRTGEASFVNNLRGANDVVLGVLSAASGQSAKQVAFDIGAGIAISETFNDIGKRPKLNRIQSAIALYMPDTVFQTYGHDYDAISATQALGNLGIAQRGGADVTKAFSGVTVAQLAGDLISGNVPFESNIRALGNLDAGKEFLGRLAEATGVVGPGFADLTLKSQGVALNPQIEMVYRQTRNRSFVFDFKLQPRSSKESRNIKNIIREFKRYAAPSLANKSYYYTIPAQFDIEFKFYNPYDGVNEENRYIGKISTCVLENIDVNYSSAGPFATFDDGSPVEIGLQLRFIEVDILTKEAFEGPDGELNTKSDDGASF